MSLRKAAHEFLAAWDDDTTDDDTTDIWESLKNLRAALAESDPDHLTELRDQMTPFYPPPREWQGLTGEEICRCLDITDHKYGHSDLWADGFAKDIESVLKEKNAKENELKLLRENGAKSWSDVKDASEWVENLRGNRENNMSWISIEHKWPMEHLDILFSDGSILCSVIPQIGDDFWWDGCGSGEKFIYSKFGGVTHWRLAKGSAEQDGLNQLNRIRKMAATGTADNWLQLPDEDKKVTFALLVQESSLRKKLAIENEELRQTLKDLQNLITKQLDIDYDT